MQTYTHAFTHIYKHIHTRVLQVQATNVEKIDDKDSWSGKGIVEGLTTSDLNSFNSDGIKIELEDDGDDVQDTVEFSGAECRLYGKFKKRVISIDPVLTLLLTHFSPNYSHTHSHTTGKGSKNLSCKKRGVGSLTMRFHETSTLTVGKNRALTNKHNTPKDGKDGREESEFWKTSFKFFNRDFKDSNLTPPLKALIEGETSATEDCKEKTFGNGRETIKCVPVEEE